MIAISAISAFLLLLSLSQVVFGDTNNQLGQLPIPDDWVNSQSPKTLAALCSLFNQDASLRPGF
eukprot:m.47773 g.47773  ORF g.47773 m.47773 type:complete len:64 (-) comp17695_c1_seq1:580-771(-)